MESDFERIEKINEITFGKMLKKISWMIIFIESLVYFLLYLISLFIMLWSFFAFFPLPSDDPIFRTALIIIGISLLSTFSNFFYYKGLKTQNVFYFIPCLILRLGFIIYLMYLILATYYEYLYSIHIFYTIILFVKIQLCIFICVQIKCSIKLYNNYDYSEILNKKPNVECDSLI